MWGIGSRLISEWNGMHLHLILPDLPEVQSLKEGFCIWACSLEKYIITKPSCEGDGAHQRYGTLMENAYITSCLLGVLMVDFQYKIIIEVIIR
jgi:hypothetical protein